MKSKTDNVQLSSQMPMKRELTGLKNYLETLLNASKHVMSIDLEINLYEN